MHYSLIKVNHSKFPFYIPVRTYLYSQVGFLHICIKNTSQTLGNTLTADCREGIAGGAQEYLGFVLLYFANLPKTLDRRGSLVYNVG